MMKNPFDLSGRRALVTGGATGIGKGIALGLAAAGADVALTYRSHEPGDTLAAIESLGVKAAAVKADFVDMDASAANEVVDFASNALGGLDILVNNAGIIHRENSVDMPIDAWRRVLSVNLDSVWLLSQAAGRKMVDQDFGKIVIVSSVLGFQGDSMNISFPRGKGESWSSNVARGVSCGVAMQKEMGVVGR